MQLPEALTAQELDLKIAAVENFLTRKIIEFKQVELQTIIIDKIADKQKEQDQFGAIGQLYAGGGRIRY